MFSFHINRPPPLLHTLAVSIMHVFGMSSRNPHEGQGEITLRKQWRGGGEDIKEDGGLKIAFRSYTELYKGKHLLETIQNFTIKGYIIIVLKLELHWAT